MVDLAARRQRRRVGLVLLEDLDQRALVPGPFEEGGRVGKVVRAEHDVDVPGALRDQLAVLLGQTASHRDLQVGPRCLERLQPAELAVELVVGVLTDAAGVEHHHVGVVEIVGRTMPCSASSPAIRSESCSFIWHP